MAAAELTIGELFPPDDVVGQWVFSLTATAADLAHVESALLTTMDGNDVSARFYFHRSLLARLYEARRVVVVIDTLPEIAEFLARVEGTVEYVEFLRSQYLPADESVVDGLYGASRHRTVHHSFVGSPELRETLAEADDEAARLIVDEGRGRIIMEYPESVITRYLNPDLNDPDKREEALEQHVKLGEQIRHSFAKLIYPMTGAYLARRSIDPQRLYVPIEDAYGGDQMPTRVS